MNTVDAAAEYFLELANVEKMSLSQLGSFCKSVKFARLVQLKQSYTKVDGNDAKMMVFLEILNTMDHR